MLRVFRFFEKMPFLGKIPFFDENFREKNLAQNHIKKCCRMILVMTLQHACSGSLSHFKFQSSSALYCHKWARSQLILNHHIISASGVSTKKSDYVQRHLLKTPRFSKSGRKSWVTPLSITFDRFVVTLYHYQQQSSKISFQNAIFQVQRSI